MLHVAGLQVGLQMVYHSRVDRLNRRWIWDGFPVRLSAFEGRSLDVERDTDWNMDCGYATT